MKTMLKPKMKGFKSINAAFRQKFAVLEKPGGLA